MCCDRCASFLLVVFVAAFSSASEGLADEPNKLTWVEIPVDGLLSILPRDEELPYTQRILNDANRTTKHRARTNPERGVYLHSDQVLSFFAQGVGPGFNDLAFLERIPEDRLRSLALLTDRVPASAVRKVKRFDALRQLWIWCEELEDFPALVKASPSLELFSLESFDPGDPDRPEGNVFGNETCKHFAGWKNLRSARVCGRRFTDAAVRELAKLPNIEVIIVAGSFKLTNDGVGALAEAKTLREVTLHVGPRCTDEGVKELLKLEHLQWIEIQGMERVEQSTIDALKARFPDAHVAFKPRVSP
jgi:hypothetical protein